MKFKASESLEFLKINVGKHSPKVLLSEHFFTNLRFITALQISDGDFSKVPNDVFNGLENLEALRVRKPINFSHIELKGLSKLKWLRFEFDKDEIPIFDQVNPDLQVLELYLRFEIDKSVFESKLFQIYLNFYIDN